MADHRTPAPARRPPRPAPPAATCAQGDVRLHRRLATEESSGYDNTIYWCLKTMKSFGPDDDFVGREDCRDDRPRLLRTNRGLRAGNAPAAIWTLPV